MSNDALVGYSSNVLALADSVTHGTREMIAQLNSKFSDEEKIIDLSIGTLDMATDPYIDEGVIDYIKKQPSLIHQFAPVKGFDFLLTTISKRILRLHNVDYDPQSEIMVTPGGIKGSISVVFHTLLNPGDEVILPLPNWPHYHDMIKLHGARTVFVDSQNLNKALEPESLRNAISFKTKLIILGDCINPTGKIYTTKELQALATVIAQINIERLKRALAPIFVLFDCPYEAHILENRQVPMAAITIDNYKMRDVVINVTGPGKTYGMHGDRIGYIYANKIFITLAARAQVNLNSFASTYGQVACFYALAEKMDSIATTRARYARDNLLQMLEWLKECSLHVHVPQGGYFIFVDFLNYASKYNQLGMDNASDFLLKKARVATIAGTHFAEGYDGVQKYKDFVRINCGRDLNILAEAAQRIKHALKEL